MHERFEECDRDIRSSRTQTFSVHWREVSNSNLTLYVLEEAFMARSCVLEGASATSFTVLKMESHQPWEEE